jgi:predicted membrane-bound dolichyl-phosphate-mannose-protein mannosyltransferase
MSLRAQTVALIIVLSCDHRGDVGELYNDTMMFTYVILCIYYRLKNRIIVSALFFSLAASVKAGAMFLIPAYLGSIQLSFGTRSLL